MRWKVHVRFTEEKQRNSSTTLCLLLYIIAWHVVSGALFCVVWKLFRPKLWTQARLGRRQAVVFSLCVYDWYLRFLCLSVCCSFNSVLGLFGAQLFHELLGQFFVIDLEAAMWILFLRFANGPRGCDKHFQSDSNPKIFSTPQNWKLAFLVFAYFVLILRNAHFLFLHRKPWFTWELR